MTDELERGHNTLGVVLDGFNTEGTKTGRMSGKASADCAEIKPYPHYSLSRDGNRWCVTYPDFINLQESPAGFGDTVEEAIQCLESEIRVGVITIRDDLFYVDWFIPSGWDLPKWTRALRRGYATPKEVLQVLQEVYSEKQLTNIDIPTEEDLQKALDGRKRS